MRNTAIHQKQAAVVNCKICGGQVVRDDQRVEVICLICHAAILNRVFQARQRARDREDVAMPPLFTGRLRWST